MEVRLTIRPRRSFIIRRRQALERRNTEVRSVAITRSQSSCFIRSSNPSRVMAALLTRIVGISSAASSWASSASMEAGSPTSSTAPRPLYACDANEAVSASAPSAVVAVPITFAPAPARARAIALPIFREAPVTSATSFLSIGSSLHRRERGGERGGVLERQEIQARPLLDAAVQAGQHLAGTTLDDLGGPRSGQRAHGVRPAHRAGQLAHQELADVLRVLVPRGIHRAQVPDPGSLDRHARQPFFQAARRRPHETAVG